MPLWIHELKLTFYGLEIRRILLVACLTLWIPTDEGLHGDRAGWIDAMAWLGWKGLWLVHQNAPLGWTGFRHIRDWFFTLTLSLISIQSTHLTARHVWTTCLYESLRSHCYITSLISTGWMDYPTTYCLHPGRVGTALGYLLPYLLIILDTTITYWYGRALLIQFWNYNCRDLPFR